MNYVWHIGVMIGLYVLLASSLNLVVGYTGLMSLCHAAFYGIGAYATTLLMINAGWNFFPALAAGVLVSIVLSLVIGIPSLRLRGDYFVLATLGFQVIVFSILYNWTDFTKGSYGIPGIPVPQLGTLKIETPMQYFWFCWAFVVIGLVLLGLMAHSPFGRTLKAVRDDEIAAGALGKNVPLLKILAFVIAAAFAAIPGGLFAGYMRFIDPTSFTIMESIFILSIVVIGGAGNMIGPILGAIFLVVLPEGLRFLHIPDDAAASLRQIIYGLLLVALMLFRPQGIKGDYKFE